MKAIRTLLVVALAEFALAACKTAPQPPDACDIITASIARDLQTTP